jgi:hypothetical protein
MQEVGTFLQQLARPRLQVDKTRHQYTPGCFTPIRPSPSTGEGSGGVNLRSTIAQGADGSYAISTASATASPPPKHRQAMPRVS